MEIMEQYAKLNHNDRDALDQAVMDEGITCVGSLMKTVDMVQTFMNEQPGAKLTFDAFRKTCTAQTMSKEWCEANGFDEEQLEVLMYDGECFIIVRSPGNFNLVVETSEWLSNDLESLEQLLYDRWYL